MNQDPDNDGLTNIDEAEYGTEPDITDTDGDGVNDGNDGWALDADLQSPRVSENYVLVDLSGFLTYPDEVDYTEHEDYVYFEWALPRPETVTLQIDDSGGILMSDPDTSFDQDYSIDEITTYANTYFQFGGTPVDAGLNSDVIWFDDEGVGPVYTEVWPILLRSGVVVFNGRVNRTSGDSYQDYGRVFAHLSGDIRSSHDLRTSGFPDTLLATNNELSLLPAPPEGVDDDSILAGNTNVTVFMGMNTRTPRSLSSRVILP